MQPLPPTALGRGLLMNKALPPLATLAFAGAPEAQARTATTIVEPSEADTLTPPLGSTLADHKKRLASVTAPARFQARYTNKSTFPILDTISLSIKNLQQDTSWTTWLLGATSFSLALLAMQLPHTRIEHILMAQANDAYAQSNIRKTVESLTMLLEKGTGLPLPLTWTNEVGYPLQDFKNNRDKYLNHFKQGSFWDRTLSQKLKWLHIDPMENTGGLSSQTLNGIARILNNSALLNNWGMDSNAVLSVAQLRELTTTLYCLLPDTDVSDMVSRVHRNCQPSVNSLSDLLYFQAKVRQLPSRSSLEYLKTFVKSDLLYTLTAVLASDSTNKTSWKTPEVQQNLAWVHQQVQEKLQALPNKTPRIKQALKQHKEPSMDHLEALCDVYTNKTFPLTLQKASLFFLQDQRFSRLFVLLLELMRSLNTEAPQGVTQLTHPLYQHPWFKTFQFPEANLTKEKKLGCLTLQIQQQLAAWFEKEVLANPKTHDTPLAVSPVMTYAEQVSERQQYFSLAEWG